MVAAGSQAKAHKWRPAFQAGVFGRLAAGRLLFLSLSAFLVFLVAARASNTGSSRSTARSSTSLKGAAHTSPASTPENNESIVETEPVPVWANYDVSELWEHLECDGIFKKERPIHEQREWMDMRKAYVHTVGSEHSTIGSPELGFNGFAWPYYVKHNEHGRGIYAKANIPEGALVWQSIRTAKFSDGPSYRAFIMRIPVPLACDVLQWAYVTEDRKINVDLDEGSFCNNGGSKEGNIDLDEKRGKKFPTPNTASGQLFATRDISKGEELLCNYGGFSTANWGQFGL